MKKIITVMCLILLMLTTCVSAKTSGVIYPHPEVEMTTTKNEGTQETYSGRVWKTVYGESVRPDMEVGELRYTVYLPENYNSEKEYPFVLFLHGGKRGYRRCNGKTMWEMDLVEFSDSFASSIEDCIIFAPQAPGIAYSDEDKKNKYWSGISSASVPISTITTDNSESSPYLRAAEKMISTFVEQGISYGDDTYTIDASRLYVVGHSMGGIGTYTILRDCPDVFAGAIIGAGIGDPDSVDLWKSTPVRIIHGTKDASVIYEATEIMQEALKGYNNAEIITLEGADHNIKPVMYGEDRGKTTNENLLWLASQDRDKPAVSYYVWIVAALVLIIAAVTIILIRKKGAKK